MEAAVCRNVCSVGTKMFTTWHMKCAYVQQPIRRALDRHAFQGPPCRRGLIAPSPGDSPRFRAAENFDDGDAKNGTCELGSLLRQRRTGGQHKTWVSRWRQRWDALQPGQMGGARNQRGANIEQRQSVFPVLSCNVREWPAGSERPAQAKSQTVDMLV